MHIANFLTTGHVPHYFVPRQNPTSQDLQLMYRQNPVMFKPLVTKMLANYRKNDPGNRRLFLSLIPLVTGSSLASGLDMYGRHQLENTTQRNNLRLGETQCCSVGKWWDGVREEDISISLS